MNSLVFMHAAYGIVWAVLTGYAVYLITRFIALGKEYSEIKK